MAKTDEELYRQNLGPYPGAKAPPYPVKGDGQPKLVPTREELRAKVQKIAMAQAINNQADPYKNETGGLLRGAVNPSGADISDSEYENRVKALRTAETPASATAAPTSPTAPSTPTTPQPPQTQAERLAAAGLSQGRNVITGDAPSTTAAAPTGEVFVSRGARPGGGMEARRYAAEGVKGSASGSTAVGRGGGFVGSATDAEATRNLQARAEQNQAAQFMVDSMNRGAETERDTRATRLGVSRGVLDRMEGRDTEAGRASLAAQTAPAPSAPGVWDRPRDSFGDAALRQNQYQSKLDDAARQTGSGAAKRQASLTEAAAKMLEPGQTIVATDTAQQKNAADLQAAQTASLVDLQKARTQEVSANQRARDQNATTLDAARINQLGGLTREQMQQQELNARDRAKNMGEVFKQGADYLAKATSPDGKNPPLVSAEKLARARAALDKGKLAEQVGEKAATRIMYGETTPEEAQQLVAMARQWDDNPASIWNLWTATAQRPSYIPQ